VVAAALATRTRRIALRAGSVVLPLHHVARVAEEWAVVDALSGGRVGLSLATGWNRADFVLGAGGFAQRRERMLESVDPLRALWRGEELTFTNDGEAVPVRTYPRPVQPELPLWLTATSGAGTFVAAGRHGCNVLTAYLQQDPAQLADHIGQYRAAFRAGGAAARPHVTLMVHACVADTPRTAFDRAYRPLLEYQSQFLALTARGHDARTGEAPLTEDEKRELARYATHKYLTERGLIGDPERVAGRLRELAGIGVDEVACLVDFGLEEPFVTETLVRLAEIAGHPGAAPVAGSPRSAGAGT
jgi:natural product biosynthesis luciferase-like monooxygenase protein